MGLALCLTLGLLVLVRAGGLGAELFDGYDVRLEAQRLLQGTGQRAPVRSPVLILAAAGFELIGLSWAGLALLSAAAYLLLMIAGARLAALLGARPWVCVAASLLLATDHLTWVYAGYGMSDVPAAATCAWLLVVACRTEDPEECRWRTWVGAGMLLGLAALLRPTLGLLGLSLLAGFRRPWTLGRLSVVAAVGVATYLVVSTATFALLLGGWSRGLAAHAELVAFMGDQVNASRARYGNHAGPLALFVAVLRSQPAFLLAIPGVALAWRAGPGRARLVMALGLLHLTVYQVNVHHEARYLIPALPALAGLAALSLERFAQRSSSEGRAPVAVVLGLALLAAVWSGPFEVARLRDPASRESFAARVAREAAAVAGPQARYVWTTTHTFPVLPRVVHERVVYPGDPFFGMVHIGHNGVGYHLGAKVRFPLLRGPGGRPVAGLVTPDELRDFVRRARHDDGSGFRAGDVLLVGIRRLSPSWDVRRRPRPAFTIGQVVKNEEGQLDVVLHRLEPE